MPGLNDVYQHITQYLPGKDTRELRQVDTMHLDATVVRDTLFVNGENVDKLLLLHGIDNNRSNFSFTRIVFDLSDVFRHVRKNRTMLNKTVLIDILQKDLLRRIDYDGTERVETLVLRGEPMLWPDILQHFAQNVDTIARNLHTVVLEMQPDRDTQYTQDDSMVPTDVWTQLVEFLRRRPSVHTFELRNLSVCKVPNQACA